MEKIENIIGDGQKFLDNVFRNLAEVNIDVENFKLDHFAYRATTNEKFNSIAHELEAQGKRLIRNTIRDRFIDIYELQVPLEYNGRKIKFIELMAPAEGDKFQEGLEHAEFIILETNLEKFIQNYPEIDWNINNMQREIGPEVGMKFVNGANVKFKTMDILEIIRLEKEKKNKF